MGIKPAPEDPRPFIGALLAMLGIFIAAAFLQGCVTVDSTIERLESFNDRALAGLEVAQAALDVKQARLDKLKCRFPYTALVRYATESPYHAATVLRDCGLSVTVDAVAISTPTIGP